MESTLKADEKYRKNPDGIISILENVQRKYGYLPKKVLETVANETGSSLVDIYGIATFYKYFSLKPRGEHLISVCLGTACHVRQAPLIVKEFENQLKIRAGETTVDKQFSLETVNCLGACARGPIVVVDGHYFSNVNKAQVSQILKKTRYGLDRIDIKKDERIFPVKLRCTNCNHSLLDPNYLIDDYPSVRLTISFGRKHGWLRLSSLWGSYNNESEYDIPVDTIVNFFCPHCHDELIGASSCPSCNAPMIPMIIYGGGLVQICSRRGCKNHMIDLINGICVNCENRHTCSFIKPEGGVWYCEEYI
ncbi:MAG: NAD(P)H-dependent oxidoreductase subunit E [Bacteroidales bacterium]|nr:NAD(P)H-dependent oxidoreductase subunit E [Bacteroidales bacterium]